jgi:hypothetical protein
MRRRLARNDRQREQDGSCCGYGASDLAAGNDRGGTPASRIADSAVKLLCEDGYRCPHDGKFRFYAMIITFVNSTLALSRDPALRKIS